MQQNQKALLVVEDDVLIRMSAVDMAVRDGFVVFEAENADRAIDLLELHPEIGLVFTDIEMPGSMDGLKLAQYVRRRWPPVKLIIASGKIRLDKALLPDGGLFFPKPYDERTILGAMHSLLAA